MKIFFFEKFFCLVLSFLQTFNLFEKEENDYLNDKELFGNVLSL